jgi:hypothetical protein
VIEESKDLWGSVWPRRTPGIIVEDLLIPLPTPTADAPELLKAASNVSVAAEQALDDPEDLTHKTTAQTPFYTHRGLDEQASSIRPGP